VKRVERVRVGLWFFTSLDTDERTVPGSDTCDVTNHAMRLDVAVKEEG
jgi:hypothetical protein